MLPVCDLKYCLTVGNKISRQFQNGNLLGVSENMLKFLTWNDINTH